MTLRTVPIVCAKAPRYIAYVPAIRQEVPSYSMPIDTKRLRWFCSYCGQRVKVVA